MTDIASTRIGVIGGTGFYEFFDAATTLTIETPYGAPSADVSIGTVAGRGVAFLPRHGASHELPAHRVNYRANLWALRSLGVRRVLAPCAAGSLLPKFGTGTVVVPDQLVDRTTARDQTYMSEATVHVSLADPYCPELRTTLLTSDPNAIDGGTMVVIEGPRFSTRAESQWHASQGWSLVNMTGQPEAALARELALCYACVALVTDQDAGSSSNDSASQNEVFDEFARNIGSLREHLVRAIGATAAQLDCQCARTLDGMTLPFELP